MATRIFIAFAIEDQKYRDLLKGQSLNVNSAFEYVDMSVKEAWDTDWKTRCRTRIRGCDGVVAMLSKNTLTATGARWEIGCAVEEKKPLVGIYISTDDKSKPPEMDGQKAVVWTWDNVAAFINGL